MSSIDDIAIYIVHLLAVASIKSAAILMIAWGVTLATRRASGAFRHLIWTLAVAGILVTPALEGILPVWGLVVLPSRTLRLVNSNSGSVVTTAVRPSGNNTPIAESFAEEVGEGELYSEPPVARRAVPLSRAELPAPSAMRPMAAIPIAVELTPHRMQFWLMLGWGAGMIGIGVLGAVGAWIVARAGRRARELDGGQLRAIFDDLRRQLAIRRPVRLLVAGDAAMPITWGIFRPRILMPDEAREWPEDRARSVLLHELAHVRRWDCATQLMALLACAIYWFNPLVWLAARQMRIERERACDDIVIGGGSSATAYAEYLVLLARKFRNQPMRNAAAVAMARRSGLADRVRAILSTSVSRREMSRRAAVISITVVLVVLIPLSAMHLMRRSARWGAALAGDATSLPSEEKLLPLPDRFSSKRVALQVLSPRGEPMPIDSIQSIYVWIPQGKWMDGPTPQILARYADGWVFVDKEMLTLALPGQRVDLTFVSGGSSMTVSAKFPSGSPKKISFDALSNMNEITVDTSAGPAVAKDEIGGQVVGPDGKPIAGAVVSFPEPSIRRGDAPATSGANGVFRMPGVGNRWLLYLQVTKVGYATRMLTDVPVGRGFIVRMDDRTRLKGQFLGSDGAPAAAAKILIVTSKATKREGVGGGDISDLMVSTTADKQGNYDLPLEPGEYELRVTAENGFGRYQHVEVPSGQIIGFSQKLGPGVKLKIVAMDTLTNKPVSGVRCFIMDEVGPAYTAERTDSERTTDSSGTAEWDKLMPGHVEVDVRSDLYARWWTDEMAGRAFNRGIDSLNIDLTEDMSPVTVHMEPGVQATGTVLSPDGKPVVGAEVNIAGLRTGDNRYARRTNAAGVFSLTFPILKMNFGNNDKPIKYAIVANDPRHRWANATGDWFAPVLGQKLSVTLKMPSGARLRGRFIGSDGKPVGNVLVRAQSDDDLDGAYYDPQAMSDDHGRFELGPMRAAHYSIYFAGDEQEIWRLRDLPSLAMTVAEGDRLEMGDINYDGTTPPPPSKWVLNNFGGHGTVPASNDAGWRQVTPVLVPVVVQPAPAPVAQPQDQVAEPSPLEEPLPGSPAPAGHLSGKVVDESGKPLAGVGITVWARDHGDKTDATGSFAFTSLPKDRAVEIRFAKDGYCPRFIPAQPAGLSGIVIVLTNKTFFEGQVKDSSGKPVAGAKIRGDQGRKQADRMFIPWVWTETSTDAQGNYRLYVQPDTYDIQVRMPGVGVARTGKLPIADGHARHLDIDLKDGITFHAHVVDSITNQPVGGIRIWSGQNPGVEGRSDQSGNFVVPSMVPGTISFNVEAKGYARWWSDAAAKEWERQPDVRSGNFQWNFNDLDYDMKPEMPEAKIVVEREVTIRGKVVDPDGLPVMGATIGAVDTGSDRSISGDERFAVLSKASGVFEMKLPASGDHGYNLIVHDGPRRTWRKWANGVLPIIRTKPGEELNDITITLTRPGVVRGYVVDASGNTVVGREVRAIGADLLEDINYEPSARTDKSGNFELKFVRPGSQMIQVGRFVYRPLMAPEGTSKTVTLTEGQTLEGVKLTAMPGDEER